MLSITETSVAFALPDLRGAIGDFILDTQGVVRNNHRRSTPTCILPFENVKIWHTFRMQQHLAQDPRIVLPPRTLQALPISTSMPHGRGNVVMVSSPTGSLMSLESERKCNYYLSFAYHPHNCPSACKVVQIRMVFSPITADNRGQQPPIYFYGHCFKFSPRNRQNLHDGRTIYLPEPGIDMFVVEHHLRANGDRMGDIFKLEDIREILELVPCFGEIMREGINCNNSLEMMESYYINNFSDKETFHAVLSYQ